MALHPDFPTPHAAAPGRPVCRDGTGRCKIAVKVVDIFGNDTMTIVEMDA